MAIEAQNMENQSSYRSIFKATSLFGGVQVYQILIGIVKAKFVAILLGPVGMGVMGLYQSTLDLIRSVSSCGLEVSGVRDVSEADGCGNNDRIAEIVAALKKLSWITGLIGAIATLVLAPYLSRITFGNNDYIWGFVFLSTTLLFNQLCSSQKVLLQGMRRLKDLAKATAIGSTIGLLVSVPIYYWIGMKGIVPTMILSSLTALLLSWFYSRRIHIEKKKITTRQAFTSGRTMLRMGIAMSITGVVAMLYAYILRGYIRRFGGVEEVGLFTAGFTIINSYVGMIFTAMGTDFYPRLAGVNKDNSKGSSLINQQIEIASLIMGPLLLMCLLFMPIVLKILYSEQFLGANDFIFWAVPGMLFKLVSWALSFWVIAKGDSKLFVICELLSGTFGLAFYLIGYQLWGLTGVGIGFTIGYFLYMCLVFFIVNKRYTYKCSWDVVKVWGIQIIFSIVCILIVCLLNKTYQYVLGGLFMCFSVFYSIRELERRVHFFSAIKQRYTK